MCRRTRVNANVGIALAGGVGEESPSTAASECGGRGTRERAWFKDTLTLTLSRNRERGPKGEGRRETGEGRRWIPVFTRMTINPILLQERPSQTQRNEVHIRIDIIIIDTEVLKFGAHAEAAKVQTYARAEGGFVTVVVTE